MTLGFVCTSECFSTCGDLVVSVWLFRESVALKLALVMWTGTLIVASRCKYPNKQAVATVCCWFAAYLHSSSSPSPNLLVTRVLFDLLFSYRGRVFFSGFVLCGWKVCRRSFLTCSQIQRYKV